MPTLFYRYNLVPPNVVVVIATRLDMWLERKGGCRGENIPAALSEFSSDSANMASFFVAFSLVAGFQKWRFREPDARMSA